MHGQLLRYFLAHSLLCIVYLGYINSIISFAMDIVMKLFHLGMMIMAIYVNGLEVVCISYLDLPS